MYTNNMLEERLHLNSTMAQILKEQHSEHKHSICLITFTHVVFADVDTLKAVMYFLIFTILYKLRMLYTG